MNYKELNKELAIEDLIEADIKYLGLIEKIKKDRWTDEKRTRVNKGRR